MMYWPFSRKEEDQYARQTVEARCEAQRSKARRIMIDDVKIYVGDKITNIKTSDKRLTRETDICFVKHVCHKLEEDMKK